MADLEQVVERLFKAQHSIGFNSPTHADLMEEAAQLIRSLAKKQNETVDTWDTLFRDMEALEKKARAEVLRLRKELIEIAEGAYTDEERIDIAASALNTPTEET